CAVAKILSHRLRPISKKEEHALKALLGELNDLVLQERPAVHRYHRLGLVVRERTHPLPTPACKYDGLARAAVSPAFDPGERKNRILVGHSPALSPTRQRVTAWQIVMCTSSTSS